MSCGIAPVFRVPQKQKACSRGFAVEPERGIQILRIWKFGSAKTAGPSRLKEKGRKTF